MNPNRKIQSCVVINKNIFALTGNRIVRLIQSAGDFRGSLESRLCCNITLSSHLEWQLDGVGPADAAKFFVDPTGTHLIVTTVNGENFYCDTTQKKSKFSSLPKWNFRISALEFLYNFSNKTGYDALRTESEPLIGASLPSSPTWTVLIGTEKGVLYETTLEAKGKFSDVSFLLFHSVFIHLLSTSFYLFLHKTHSKTKLSCQSPDLFKMARLALHANVFLFPPHSPQSS